MDNSVYGHGYAYDYGYSLGYSGKALRLSGMVQDEEAIRGFQDGMSARARVERAEADASELGAIGPDTRFQQSGPHYQAQYCYSYGYKKGLNGHTLHAEGLTHPEEAQKGYINGTRARARNMCTQPPATFKATLVDVGRAFEIRDGVPGEYPVQTYRVTLPDGRTVEVSRYLLEHKPEQALAMFAAEMLRKGVR